MKYFIKDLGIGHGVFVKQEEPIVIYLKYVIYKLQDLKDNMIVNVGEAHIVVNVLKEFSDDYEGYG